MLEKSEFKDESQFFRFHADEEMEGTSSKNRQLRSDFKLVENILAKRLLVGARLMPKGVLTLHVETKTRPLPVLAGDGIPCEGWRRREIQGWPGPLPGLLFPQENSRAPHFFSLLILAISQAQPCSVLTQWMVHICHVGPRELIPKLFLSHHSKTGSLILFLAVGPVVLGPT